MEFVKVPAGEPFQDGVYFNFALNIHIYQIEATHIPTKLVSTAFSDKSYDYAGKAAMEYIEKQLEVIDQFLEKERNADTTA